jgi:hypothetical protein
MMGRKLEVFNWFWTSGQIRKYSDPENHKSSQVAWRVHLKRPRGQKLYRIRLCTSSVDEDNYPNQAEHNWTDQFFPQNFLLSRSVGAARSCRHLGFPLNRIISTDQVTIYCYYSTQRTRASRKVKERSHDGSTGCVNDSQKCVVRPTCKMRILTAAIMASRYQTKCIMIMSKMIRTLSNEDWVQRADLTLWK